MTSLLRPAAVLLLALTLLTGVAYPLLVTAIAQAIFPTQAAGSLLTRDAPAPAPASAPASASARADLAAAAAPAGSILIGSTLIAQSFTAPKHFWPRPSATAPQPYNGTASGASNLGPLNPALTDAIKSRIEALRAADPANKTPIPIDLVTASASGLDPDISLAAAYYQAPRVARERNLQPKAVNALIATHSHTRWLGILGEPRVNVLELNLALDAMK